MLGSQFFKKCETVGKVAKISSKKSGPKTYLSVHRQQQQNSTFASCFPQFVLEELQSPKNPQCVS